MRPHDLVRPSSWGNTRLASTSRMGAEGRWSIWSIPNKLPVRVWCKGHSIRIVTVLVNKSSRLQTLFVLPCSLDFPVSERNDILSILFSSPSPGFANVRHHEKRISELTALTDRELRRRQHAQCLSASTSTQPLLHHHSADGTYHHCSSLRHR